MNLSHVHTIPPQITSLTVLATSNGSIEGSGVEDIGFRRHEASARIAEHRDMSAEREARNRRLDIDRILQSALDSLESEATDGAMRLPQRGGHLTYIGNAAGIHVTRFADYQDRANYIAELLTDIREGFSPVVREEK